MLHIIEFFYYYAEFNAPCVGYKYDESQAHDESQFVREQNYPIGRALGLLMKYTEGPSTRHCRPIRLRADLSANVSNYNNVCGRTRL